MSEKQKGKKNYIIDAVIMLSIGITFLLVLIGVFGRSGKVIADFLVGSLGYAVYGYCVGLILFAILKLCKLTPKLNLIKILSITLSVAMLLALLHVISTNRFIGDNTSYSEYLISCYNNPVTAGGIIGGVFIYPILKLNYIFAVVLTALLTVGALCLVVFTQFDTKSASKLSKRSKTLELQDLNAVDGEQTMKSVGNDLFVYDGSEDFRTRGRKMDNDYVPLDSLNEESGRQVLNKDILSGIPAADDNYEEKRKAAIEILFNKEDTSSTNDIVNNENVDKTARRNRLIDRLAKRKDIKKTETPTAENIESKADSTSSNAGKDYFDIEDIIVNKQENPISEQKTADNMRNNYDSHTYKPLIDSVLQNDSQTLEDIWSARSKERKENQNNNDAISSRKSFLDSIEKLNASANGVNFNKSDKNTDSWNDYNNVIEDLNADFSKDTEKFGFNVANDSLNQTNEQADDFSDVENYDEQPEELYSELFENDNNFTDDKSDEWENNSFDEVVIDVNNTQEDNYYDNDIIADIEEEKEVFEQVSNADISEQEFEEEIDEEVIYDNEDYADTSLNTHYNVENREIKREKTNKTNNYAVGQADKGGDIKVVKKPYKFPPISLLMDNKSVEGRVIDKQSKIDILESTLSTFKIDAKVVNTIQGPVFCRFELQMPMGISVNKIKPFENDIAMCLEAGSVRCQIPIPNKNAFGVEIPNDIRGSIGLKSILASPDFMNNKQKLSIILGQDCEGQNYVVDLVSLCHVLIAGSTGAGKSVCLNTLICSLIYKYTPDDVRLLLVDPKQIEFYEYDGIPHLLLPNVLTTDSQCLSALDWAIEEMERRFDMIKNVQGARDLDDYNKKLPEGVEKLPYIVIVIDEVGDLMVRVKKELEERIIRLTQKARASGIILVIATQRPSVNVITGVIKANLPSRVAFTVNNFQDSKTILNQGGAEKLLRKGDMLFLDSNIGQLVRIQGAFISGDDVTAVCNYVKANNESYYDESVVKGILERNRNKENVTSNNVQERNDATERLVIEAGIYCAENNFASASMLQRRFSIGYNKAAKIIETLESLGYVSKETDAVKRRKMLVTKEELEHIYNLNNFD